VGGDKKGSLLDPDGHAPAAFTVPEPPAWDMNMRRLKRMLLELVDGRATPCPEGSPQRCEWASQESYLARYTAVAEVLAEATELVPSLSRTDVVAELVGRMVEDVAAKCAFARAAYGADAPNVVVAPPPVVDAYEPRVDLAAVGKKGGGKKPAAKDGKKDAKGKKGAAEDEKPLPSAPLASSVKAKVRPLQLRAAREAVADAMAEFCSLVVETAPVAAPLEY
jgi:hypothetical protein